MRTRRVGSMEQHVVIQNLSLSSMHSFEGFFGTYFHYIRKFNSNLSSATENHWLCSTGMWPVHFMSLLFSRRWL